MFPFNFRLGEIGVEVRIGNLVVRRIAFADIESVQPGHALWNEHWNNVWPFQFVTIRRRSGFIRNFVINPTNRDEFITRLRVRTQALPKNVTV